MADKAKKSLTVEQFLAGDRKLNQLSREELAALDAELDKEDWLKEPVIAALKAHIV